MLERKQLMMAATVGPPKLLARNVVTFQVGRHKSPGGFTFVGRFARCEGKVEHRLAIISLPGQPVLYVQRLRVLVNVDAKEIATGIIAVLNEDARPLSRNERNVWTAAGRQIMAGAAGSPAKLHVWKTHWVNLDDRLGVGRPSERPEGVSRKPRLRTGAAATGTGRQLLASRRTAPRGRSDRGVGAGDGSRRPPHASTRAARPTLQQRRRGGILWRLAWLSFRGHALARSCSCQARR